MKKIITIVIFLFNLNILSQSKFNSNNIEVALGDLETNTYTKDSSSNALVLYEYGNSYFDKKGIKLLTDIKKKIKIFNKNKSDKTTIEINLYKNEKLKEKVLNISASTYNLVDGKIKITPLNTNQIFEEKYDDNNTILKFTFPNVIDGSVIVYSYTLESPFVFKYKNWCFQDNIPKLYSIYKTSIPFNLKYYTKLIGYLKLFREEYEVEKKCVSSKLGIPDYNLTQHIDCNLSTYIMKDIPAFVEEDYMTAKKNFLSKLDFELKNRGNKSYTKTWEDVDNEIKEDVNIGEQLKKTVNLSSFFDEDIINEKNLTKKAISIYKYVQDNYTWNGKYQIFKNSSIKNLVKNKSGNVSSINILLHNLLLKAKIGVKPVLLSTRENGLVTKLHPVLSDFNYLIVQVKINDKTYLLDATDKYLSFGELPFRCLNQYGRLLDFKKGSKWINLKPKNKSSILYNVELSFDEQQNLIGKVKSKTTGYHALHSKREYYSNKEKYISNLQNSLTYAEINNYVVSSNGKTSKNFIESYQLKYGPENTGKMIYLDPFIVKFFKENPFKLQDRTYPIDFGYEDSYLYIFKLNFDKNYNIIDKPKDISLSLPKNSGKIIFTNFLRNNSIEMVFEISFKESIYPPEYYPYLKEFMSKIVDIQKNSLILLKKK